MEEHQASHKLPVCICSRHPLVYRTLEKILTAMSCIIKPFSQTGDRGHDKNNWILIVDTYSVEEWLEIAAQWGCRRGRPIILMADHLQSEKEELRLVYLGVRGIVPIANLENELVRAVDLVMKGQLWLRRSTLNEHVMHNNSSVDFLRSQFTIREEQIIAFVLKGFSNKEIANALGISDRTVKFHVSNILRKFSVKNRRALLRIKRSETKAGEPPINKAVVA